MTGSAFRTEGDYRRGLNARDDVPHFRSQSPEVRERCEAAIFQSNEMQLTHAETLRCAFRLELSRRRKRRPSRDSGEVADAFGAVSGDDQMHLTPFASESGEQRPDHALIVGMGEDSEQRTVRSNCGSLLKASRGRKERKYSGCDDSRVHCAH